MLVSIPEALLPCSLRGGVVVPHFLGHGDHPWLRSLLEEYESLVDRPRKEVARQLLGGRYFGGPTGKMRVALHVLERLRGDRRGGSIQPERVRAELFCESARSRDGRDDIVKRVATSLGATPEEIDASLFADLPGERLVAPAREPLSAAELALRTNQAIVQSLLFRSAAVELRLTGGARAVVRHARLRGLICTVSGRAGGTAGDLADATIEISGPFSLFRRTLLYGRALAELVPLLAWSPRFALRATCRIRDHDVGFHLRSGDPVFPAAEPRLYDSRLEERFARDFRRTAPNWDVLREPEPIEVGGNALVFPDFALIHRIDGRRWLVEIVGFWTNEYLERKLAAYAAARVDRLLLCVDEDRRCAVEGFPFDGQVVFFRRRVDPSAVLAAMGEPVPDPPARLRRRGSRTPASTRDALI